MSIADMHYWPVGGPAMACNANAGFRTSDRSKVNCTACQATFTVDPIADRRQRAREAGQDEFGGSYGGVLPDAANAIDAAIEVATQVKITNDIVNAARRASTIGFETPSGIRAAFRAAGFEVVE